MIKKRVRFNVVAVILVVIIVTVIFVMTSMNGNSDWNRYVNNSYDDINADGNIINDSQTEDSNNNDENSLEDIPFCCLVSL